MNSKHLSFTMTSSFDNLPHELLCRILQYFGDSKCDLHQIRLINKSCQSIAEAHLFEKLMLTDPYARSGIPYHFFFLLKPQRCNLAKTLIFDPKYAMALNKHLLVMFPNIQRLCHSGYYYNSIINWVLLSKVFTAKRCKLKKIPTLFSPEADEAKGYTEMICSHRETLEELHFAGVVPQQVVKHMVNAQNMFPRMKKIFGFELEGGGVLQDLDTIINKCPVLEDLSLSVNGEELSFKKLVPVVQHQQMMKSVCLSRCPSLGFLDLCNYFLAKFPNVQSWSCSTADIAYMEKDDQPVSVYEAIDFLNSNSLTQPEELTLSFPINHSSLQKAFDIFCESGICQKRITIGYLKFCDESRRVTDKNKSIVELTITNRNAWPPNGFEVNYLPASPLAHLGFIETVGHCIQWLFLELPLGYDYKEVTPRADQMLRGGMITHALRNCPALETLKVAIDCLAYLDPIDIVHTKLRDMHIRTDHINEELLFKLSYYAPYLNNLRIEADFNNFEDHKEKKKKIVINMPYNSFNRLELFDSKHSADSTTYDHITIQIVLPTRPAIKYLFKKHKIVKKGSETKSLFEEQNFDSDALLSSHVNTLTSYTDIAITCKSIKSLKYSEDESASADSLYKTI